MIEVSVVLSRRTRTLRDVTVRGHGDKGDAGYSTVCAAVTALARSAARTVEGYGSLSVDGEADSPGNLRFSIRETEDTGEGDYLWLMGVTDYFMTGIRDIAQEHPQECRVEVSSEGDDYGT